MEFRILGPLEVHDDGRVVALGQAKPRAVLAVLLLHANEPVSAERLAAALWGEDAPAASVKTVQVYVSRLRKALGDADVLVTTPAGYRLQLRDGALDAVGFERGIAAGREALATGRADVAAELLEAALALWRGPPLAEFAWAPFAPAAIGRLEERHVEALELRVEAGLAAGRHVELVAELQRLTTDYPWHERLHAHLMLALYRGGRQADALEAYREARRVLVDKLGIEPGPELRDLQQAILAHDPALDAPRPLAPASEPRVAVPAPPNRTIGRADDVRAVVERLRSGSVGLLTLTGPGGVGKTRLALEAARAVAADFADGAHFVSLASVGRPQDVPAAIVRALAVIPLADESAADAVVRFLAAKHLLLVVDNCEQLPHAAPFIGGLRARCPAVTVLATSREPLAVQAEQLYPVLPLALPPRERPSDTVAGGDAVTLFCERARAHDPGIELSVDTAAAVAEICRRLDGLPLAIELAAARCGLLSPREIADRLDDALSALGTAPRDAPARHQTLRATLDWSHRLLDGDERACFARFAVFAGGATIEAAETITGAGIDTLDRLVAKSLLVRRRQPDGSTRLGMLATIREYAGEQFGTTADREAVHERHSRFYQALAERAEQELRGSRQGQWLERLDAENDNVRRAIAWSAERANLDCALRTGAALWRYWQVRGQLDEGREQLEYLLSRRTGATAARALAQLTIGRCAWLQGDFDAAERFVAMSLPAHRKLDDAYSLAFALTILGAAKGTQGDDDQAEALLAEALAVARHANIEWCESLALGYTGAWLLGKGEFTQARHTLEESLRGMRRCGDTRFAGITLSLLAHVALAGDDREQARSRLGQALPIYRELGDVWGIAMTLEMLASIALDDGDERQAGMFLAEALRVASAANGRPELVAALGSFARLAAMRRDARRAARLYACASTIDDRVTAYPLRARRPDFATQVADVQASLGREAFAEAWAQGRAMTLEEAIAYALEGEAAPGLVDTRAERDHYAHAHHSVR